MVLRKLAEPSWYDTFRISMMLQNMRHVATQWCANSFFALWAPVAYCSLHKLFLFSIKYKDFNNMKFIFCISLKFGEQWARGGEESDKPSSFGTQGTLNSSAGMENSYNIAFNSAKLVCTCYLTEIFHSTLIKLAPLVAKRNSFSNISNFCTCKWNKQILITCKFLQFAFLIFAVFFFYFVIY